MTTYLKAKDILSTLPAGASPRRYVQPDTPVVDILPRLLDAPDRILGVSDTDGMLGVITEQSLLDGMGRMIAPRDDSSLIAVECNPQNYSASQLAHAVEDAGAHLVDLWTSPTDHGTVMATLRVRHSDPSSAVHHLERYGYEVVEASGANFADAETAMERLRELQFLIDMK